MISFAEILLSKDAELSDKCKELIDTNVEAGSVPKGTILQRPGDTHQKAYLVQKGLLRSYIIDEKGKEHIYMFAPEGWIMSDIESYSKGTGTTLFIEALEDTAYECVEEKVVISIDQGTLSLRDSLEKLIRRIGVLQRRVLMLISAPAKERYLEFIKTYPDIVQRVPQRMVASYLGITPEALSKIRSEIVKEK